MLGAWRQAPGAAALVVETPLDGAFLRQLAAQLDAGEAGAIALAVERGASLLLMDELDGRKVARRHGPQVPTEGTTHRLRAHPAQRESPPQRPREGTSAGRNAALVRCVAAPARWNA